MRKMDRRCVAKYPGQAVIHVPGNTCFQLKSVRYTTSRGDHVEIYNHALDFYIACTVMIFTLLCTLLKSKGYRPSQLDQTLLESEVFHNKSYELMTEREKAIKDKYKTLLTLPYGHNKCLIVIAP